MTTVILLAIAIILIVFAIRQVKQGHDFDDGKRIEALCRKAQRTYPQYPMIKALDLLYNDVYDQLKQARSEGKDTTQFIEERQLIARERARLISAATQRENGLKLIHGPKVA
jgi:preprotein translocase subunit SecF